MLETPPRKLKKSLRSNRIESKIVDYHKTASIYIKFPHSFTNPQQSKIQRKFCYLIKFEYDSLPLVFLHFCNLRPFVIPVYPCSLTNSLVWLLPIFPCLHVSVKCSRLLFLMMYPRDFNSLFLVVRISVISVSNILLTRFYHLFLLLLFESSKTLYETQSRPV